MRGDDVVVATHTESGPMTFLVHINEQSYAVTNGVVSDIEARILDAVRAGGAFVDLNGSGGRASRALISPASWVRIEKLPESAEPVEGGEEFPDLAFLDFSDCSPSLRRPREHVPSARPGFSAREPRYRDRPDR